MSRNWDEERSGGSVRQPNDFARADQSRDPYDQRGFGRDDRSPNQNGVGRGDSGYEEHGGDYRGANSGLDHPRDYRHELGRSAATSSSAGRDGFRARSDNPVETPWGSGFEYISENRGAYGPSLTVERGQNSIRDFGARTRNEARYYSADRQGQGHFGRGPKGYTRSDERIREDVCERLSENDEVDASDVEVSVREREVTLTGTVETRRMKHIAEDLADAVPGVEDVHNDISVRKGLLKEIADKFRGEPDNDEHHAHGGTKGSVGTSGSSTAIQSGTLGVTGNERA